MAQRSKAIPEALNTYSSLLNLRPLSQRVENLRVGLSYNYLIESKNYCMYLVTEKNNAVKIMILLILIDYRIPRTSWMNPCNTPLASEFWIVLESLIIPPALIVLIGVLSTLVHKKFPTTCLSCFLLVFIIL
jgi:hypothetical protein